MMNVIHGTVLILLVASLCAMPVAVAAEEQLEDGDPCQPTDFYLSKACGYVLDVPFRAQITYLRPNGQRKPLRSAEVFEVERRSDNPEVNLKRLRTTLDHRGRIVFALNLHHSETRWCRDGVVTTSHYYGTQTVRFRARGCSDFDVELTHGSEILEIAMECPDRGWK